MARRSLALSIPSLPLYHVSGLYILFRDERAVYIGRSANVRTRILAHGLRFKFDDLHVIPLRDHARLYRMERRLIALMTPCENRSVAKERI